MWVILVTRARPRFRENWGDQYPSVNLGDPWSGEARPCHARQSGKIRRATSSHKMSPSRAHFGADGLLQYTHIHIYTIHYTLYCLPVFSEAKQQRITRTRPHCLALHAPVCRTAGGFANLAYRLVIVPEDISKSIKAHLVQFFSRSVEHHWILTALRTDQSSQYIPDNIATVDPRFEEILSSPRSVSREARN